MALPRADIREARRDARKPPKPPSLANQVPGAAWGSSMSPTGQLQTPTQATPLGGAVTEGANGTWSAPSGFSTAPGAPGPQQSLAAQGSQFGQRAAMDALNQIRGYTSPGMTGAERDAMNASIQRGTAQSQAAIRSLAQRAASRGAMDSGGLWAAQGAAAQAGGNAAAGLGADMGLAAQQRALGATQGLYSMGQGIDAAAQGRGGAQDALNMGLTGMRLGALGQDYGNRMQAYQAAQDQRRAWMSMLGGLGSSAMGSFGGGNR